MPHAHLNLHEPTGDAVETTTCYMCACRCGIRVHLKNGRVRYIDGNPRHPVNRGVICAKGSAGIMQHYSPARLSKPLLRVGARGAREFREIEWDEALALAAKWLGDIRARNPDELAFFTGRDQSQALTGWWAQQFGTINYAAHGGFCSVNMAAAGMYTLGGSFWEFGEPDWDLTRYLMLWGVAEDHDSNPIKLGLGKLKARGAKIVAINPVRTGYGAIADEWVPINPGTDGLLAGALIHELLHADRIDLDYLVRYTNAHHLVISAPGAADDGMIARDAQGRALCAARVGDEGPRSTGYRIADAAGIGISPLVIGEYLLADGRTAVPAFQLFAERYMAVDYAPDAVATTCGIDAATIRRLARELAEVAFEQAIRLPQRWTDAWGREHEEMIGRPVAMHAMRGISAHANGFHTCRTLHLLQMILGAIDTPGSFRYQPPYPKPAPPPNRPGKTRKDDGALDAGPLGYVHTPDDLVVDARGEPRRIDKAFSWQHPFAAHGMLQNVIANACAGDPYRIDTLFLFMANMGWNSAMNTSATRAMLCERDPASGEYRIPHVIYVDAYDSETVAFADLVLPDTTYLERHDCISLLDRPISDADGASDAIRQPVVQPDRDVRPFQDVLLDLGARLRLPGLVDDAGAPKYPRGYAQYMVEHERAPGVGLLAGWRGADGAQDGVGAPNPGQLARYVEHGCHWHRAVPDAGRYYKMANRDYLEWAKSLAFVGSTQPIVLQFYAETLQRFRLAARGHGAMQPPDHERARVERYFDPLPFHYASLAPLAGEGAEGGWGEGSSQAFPHPDSLPQAGAGVAHYPLAAITQRPMFMYHAWGSQNRWLRQIATRNYLYVNPRTAAEHGVADGDWIWLVAPRGRIRVQARMHAGTAPGTVWTWNAIGKHKGAWKLAADAPENVDGFLLNHLIDESLRDRDGRARCANADPVTGQAAWFDLRVRIERDAEPRRDGHRIELSGPDG
ncbi:molybdopterin oxidoreductase family protein [Dokdonella fugitiva]|uniref:Molybdopterin dinucleotide binding protein n=1 Tax=Dokdonella fugitiva TaxID=328517 RepID=A0A4R2IAA2_9GAMM|nr:molybdopterin oxidoreductase family protein [Dokdonella fugitiva]TCO41393.1 molybdopterin dinucleotide binding protein [Dokdonella fugitiva]